MKIALAHNLYEPYAKGGAEKVVQRMANNLIAQGHQVFIISTKPKTGKYLEEKILSENLKLYQVSSFYHSLPGHNKLRRALLLFNNFCNPRKKLTFKKILEAEKPELLISHNLIGLGFFINNLASSLKIEQEHFLHDIQLLHPSGLMTVEKERFIDSCSARMYQLLCRQYFLKIKKIISPSKWLLELHQQKGFFKNKETEIRPLRSRPLEQVSSSLNKEDDLIKKNKQFLFVGQLEKHKGLLFLIKTFKKLADKDASLVIVGEGEDKAKAIKLSESDKRISFLGFLKSEEIKIISSQSQALIVPSLCYENSPTVIYEANALNLKVIASNIGGIPEIIKTGDVLFKAGKEDDLLKLLEKEVS